MTETREQKRILFLYSTQKKFFFFEWKTTVPSSSESRRKMSRMGSRPEVHDLGQEINVTRETETGEEPLVEIAFFSMDPKGPSLDPGHEQRQVVWCRQCCSLAIWCRMCREWMVIHERSLSLCSASDPPLAFVRSSETGITDCLHSESLCRNLPKPQQSSYRFLLDDLNLNHLDRWNPDLPGSPEENGQGFNLDLVDGSVGNVPPRCVSEIIRMLSLGTVVVLIRVV